MFCRALLVVAVTLASAEDSFRGFKPLQAGCTVNYVAPGATPTDGSAGSINGTVGDQTITLTDGQSVNGFCGGDFTVLCTNGVLSLPNTAVPAGFGKSGTSSTQLTCTASNGNPGTDTACLSSPTSAQYTTFLSAVNTQEAANGAITTYAAISACTGTRRSLKVVAGVGQAGNAFFWNTLACNTVCQQAAGVTITDECLSCAHQFICQIHDAGFTPINTCFAGSTLTNTGQVITCPNCDSKDSKKGLLGLLGLLGLIPLLLCCLLLLICCLRRKRTEKDAHFATFDPQTAPAPVCAPVPVCAEPVIGCPPPMGSALCNTAAF